VVKTEPGVEAVHLACHSANKWLLCKLRQERLHACLSTDARSVNVRVRDLTLNSCTLVAKLAPSYKDTHFHDLAKVRDAMNKLVQNAKVMTPDEIRENEGRHEMDAIEQQVRDILNENGTIGMTDEEFQEKTGGDESFRLCLMEMIERGDVKICGVWKKRYVHLTHIDPWAVVSVRFTKEGRELSQRVVCDSTGSQTEGDVVKFLPRPWLKPDGTINKPMLRWLSEGVFLRIMSMPGVTDSYIQEQFISVLDPRETAELTEFLVNIGCVTRIEKEFCQKKPRLFGPPAVEKIIRVSYEPPMDALIKFAVAFEKTPMPEFVQSWLTGASGADRGAAVFGRRRMRPTPQGPGGP